MLPDAVSDATTITTASARVVEEKILDRLAFLHYALGVLTALSALLLIPYLQSAWDVAHRSGDPAHAERAAQLLRWVRYLPGMDRPEYDDQLLGLTLVVAFIPTMALLVMHGALLARVGRWLALRCLCDMPRKINNNYAIGSTACRSATITRGTPSPSDDIPVARGQAWISITSPTDGTSHVTAFAPKVTQWDNRQQTATILWIDAQFSFASPVIGAVGTRQTLTTLVSRPSDVDADKWIEPMLKAKHLKDPWANPFMYSYPGNQAVYDLLCHGADGQAGGEGDNADISLE